VPNQLVPMAIGADAPAPVTTEIVAPRPSAAAATTRRPSTGKRSAAESWADWRATGSAASAKSFCDSVLSWLEGASAQLMRPLWPVGGVRPTSTEVQVQLRRGLALVVADEPDYVKALDAARRHVAGELSKQRARDLAAG
jgi:hypothetical protein